MKSLLLLLVLAGVAWAGPTPVFPDAKPIEGLTLKTRSFEDSSFNFRIGIPSGWGRVTARFDLKELAKSPQTLALYRSTTGSTAEIEVQVFPLQREVTAVDWLQQFAHGLGTKTLGLKVHAAPDPIPDALLERSVGKDRFIFRIAALKNGDRIFIVWCRASSKDYPNRAAQFASAVTSFTLTNPQTKRYAEPLTKTTFERPFPVTVQLPKSWTSRLLATDADLASMIYEWRVGEQVMGAIGVKLYPPSDEAPTDFIKVFDDDMRAAKVTVQPPIVDKPLKPHGARKAGLLRVYPGTRGKIGVEARLFVLQFATGWAVLTLVSPDQEINNEVLMLNRRAFDVAAIELKPIEGNKK